MSVGRDNQRTYLDLNGSAQNGHISSTTGPVEPPAPQLGDGKVDTNRVSRTAVPSPRWEIRYAQVAAVSDLTAMALSLGFHKLWGAWPGYDHARVTFGLVIMALTVIALGFAGAWEPSVQGQGSGSGPLSVIELVLSR
jgi:hypothetical protein